MSSYPPGLRDHLDGTVTTLCHCWRLTRRDGAVMGFTDHDLPLTVDSTGFAPGSGFTASEARQSLGLSVDAADIEGALSSNGIDAHALMQGLFDGASIEVLLVNWAAPDQFATIRRAEIRTVTSRDGRFVAELVGRTHAFDQVSGRVASRACDAEVGDARCGVSLARPDFVASGTVVTQDGAGTLTVAGLDARPSGWFSGGVASWTTGTRAGRADRILTHVRGSAGVLLDLHAHNGPDPQAGDAFTITAGCDKSFATCRAKFLNAANFRGFPHLPGNDAAYGYAKEGDVFDGAPLVP